MDIIKTTLSGKLTFVHRLTLFSGISRAWAVGSLTLLFLQSITWSSGLMFLSAPTFLLACLFSSLNTVQGLLITILHCSLARKVCDIGTVLASVCQYSGLN